ncbi:MAG: J domain-containing protein [Sulfurospirillum sp.]|nr:J domain-containing protein [Sulfurospirillum sp.]MBL0703706.1 J domain-containing protein [Sulfurospirillum sp.]
MSKSLYATLGVSQNANSDEIKKAYRRLARKYHPDINKEAEAEDKFKEINAAYEILSDKSKKLQYDQHGDSMFGGQNFHDFASQQGGANLNDILRSMFGGGMSSGFGDFGMPDLDVNARITIPFSIAVLGGKHSVNYNGESFDVKVPAGLKNGEKLRIKNKGKNIQGQRGDMILSVEVSESIEYDRKGSDLVKTIDIPLKFAFFGGKIKVETLYKEITLKVKEGTKNNQKFRVKEYGAMNRKAGIKGDLYLKTNIVIPSIDDLDDNLIELLKDKLPEK